jgi:hypothetical protein
MTEIKISVGKDEPHTVYVTASFWTRHLKISVDDKPYSVSKGMGSKKVATISVGEKEKHQVDVDMRGFLPRLKVSVDNKLVAT